MEFPNTKLGGREYVINKLTPSVVRRYTNQYGQYTGAWTKYLVRELLKVPGGMRGLEHHAQGAAK